MTNNRAIVNGGAISYNSYAPIMINNTMENNTAGFRDDLSSYPVKIMHIDGGGELVELDALHEIPSGLIIDNEIKFAVVNVEGNILTSDSQSTIKLLSLTDGATVLGQNVASLKNGVASFTESIFTADPGSKHIKYLLRSSAIDYAKVQYLDAEKYKDQTFDVNFRWCKPGEIQVGNTCATCTAGTYSVVWNGTECKSCPDFAACEGEMISLNKGYWRIDPNSTDIMECPNADA